MRKAGGELSMLLLLVVAWAAATWPVSNASDAPGPASDLVKSSKQIGVPGIPFTPPIVGGGDPKIMACWNSLRGVHNCVNGIFGSLYGGQMRLSTECCKAINGLSSYCYPKMFAVPVFGSSYPNELKNYCHAPVPPTPPAPLTPPTSPPK